MKRLFALTARLGLALLITFSAAGVRIQAEINPVHYAVQVSATIQTAPPRIDLSWAPDANASEYSIYRKGQQETSWQWEANLGGSATSWPDSNVDLGSVFEYRVVKATTKGYQGTGYILAGIDAPMIEKRGKVIFLVDSTHAAQLGFELARLEQDLIGDGWAVIRRDVPRDASTPAIKKIIESIYATDPANVNTVFLFGRIAVPYSGNFNPDGHPDHRGAWPADLFYGDMDGTWTDSSVHATSAERAVHRNIPGDGKFDQSTMPSRVELAVGRVDFANMTCYANKLNSRSEVDLLRAYLEKDHQFRTGRIPVNRRGIVADNFGEREGEAFAASGWRNFAPFFSARNNFAAPAWTFFPATRSESYLWAYGAGGGSYYTCNGVGGSDDFATSDVQAVFTMFLGSYFGDWDNESNFLRAALGSGTVLTTSWAGRPHWFYHHMGLGEPIGYSTKESQNNGFTGLYGARNHGTSGVHVALLGDPTLRMHPVIPPSTLTAQFGRNGVVLNWSASADSAIEGYAVYRSDSEKGPFTRISGDGLLGATGFIDPAGRSGQTYMARAVKLEQSGSGTYYNPSVGIFATAQAGSAVEEPQPSPIVSMPATPTNLRAVRVSSNYVTIAWSDRATNETAYRIYRKTGLTGSYKTWLISSNSSATSTSSMQPATAYYYKVQATNSAGASGFSNEILVETPAVVIQTTGGTNAVPATYAAFVSKDSSTLGNWKGVYGARGYHVLGSSWSYPSFAQVSTGGALSWVWDDPAKDASALWEAPVAERVAGCWYSPTSFDVNINFTDGLVHRVAFYCLDYDLNNREQTVEVLARETGQVLNRQNLSVFGNGAYLNWDVKGSVTFRFKRVAGYNAVVSGLFINN